jgi:hypothetical protein
MQVRRAVFADINQLVNFLYEYHKTSNLSDIPFVRKDVVKVLEYAISRRDCLPLVAVNDEGEIKGVLCVELVPFFFNSSRKYITDLMFISKGAGMQLLREMIKWADSVGASRIIMAVSSGDPRADAFLELSGLEKTGNMYVLHR